MNDDVQVLPKLPPSKPKKKQGSRGDGFFESLRDIGSSTVKSFKNDFVRDTGRGIYDQILNSRLPSARDQKPGFDIQEYIRRREEEARLKGQDEQRHFERSKKEYVVFSLADEQVKREVQQIRQEIEILRQTIGKVENNLEQAIIEEVIEPGVYHLNFFRKIKIALQMAQRSLSDANLWLDMWSSRKDRSHYWKMAKTKGTKFTLSQERYMATQAG